ncbi:hypothetical protein [Sorangium sp. So ce1099]|uniref:hypothetical protein n=1 Tax=Sorangium sp. So ce1099 TaxID=3133331 RepID=UPI003F61668F
MEPLGFRDRKEIGRGGVPLRACREGHIGDGAPLAGRLQRRATSPRARAFLFGPILFKYALDRSGETAIEASRGSLPSIGRHG